jgi:hypothetical protein
MNASHCAAGPAARSSHGIVSCHTPRRRRPSEAGPPVRSPTEDDRETRYDEFTNAWISSHPDWEPPPQPIDPEVRRMLDAPATAGEDWRWRFPAQALSDHLGLEFTGFSTGCEFIHPSAGPALDLVVALEGSALGHLLSRWPAALPLGVQARCSSGRPTPTARRLRGLRRD